MITYISIDKLHAHPDNPRADVGDVMELAESIKASGLLQNLTVVPADGDGEYRIVIGHRRFAAAKLAGLTELPCAISDMNYNEQIATMLSENMQRTDLTVYEQAQGIQMMLDLGEDITTISEKTGFSPTTIRRRTKLLELDREKFKECVERGVTLMDFAKLEQIEDINRKNELLEVMGTNNFNWRFGNALEVERKNKWLQAATEKVKEFASQIDDPKNVDVPLKIICGIYPNKPAEDIEEPIHEVDEELYFTTTSDKNFASSYYSITLYKTITANDEDEQDEEDIATQEKNEKIKLSRIQLSEDCERAFNLRMDYIKNYSKAKKSVTGALEFCTICSMCSERYCEFDNEMMGNLLGIDIDYDLNDEELIEVISNKFKSFPEKVAIAAAYSNQEDSERAGWTDYSGYRYKHNRRMDLLYKAFAAIGYMMSDIEKSLQDGTHPAYIYEE